MLNASSLRTKRGYGRKGETGRRSRHRKGEWRRRRTRGAADGLREVHFGSSRVVWLFVV
jgi:hypothetical protein